MQYSQNQYISLGCPFRLTANSAVSLFPQDDELDR